MPGWRDLVDVAVQSLVILQLTQYLHTVSWRLTGTNSIPSRVKESKGGYETPHLRSSYYLGRSNHHEEAYLNPNIKDLDFCS